MIDAEANFFVLRFRSNTRSCATVLFVHLFFLFFLSFFADGKLLGAHVRSGDHRWICVHPTAGSS